MPPSLSVRVPITGIGVVEPTGVIGGIEEVEVVAGIVARLLKPGSQWVDKHGAAWNRADAEGLEFVKGLNRELIYLPPEEEARWKAQMAPLLEKYLAQAGEKGLPGAEFLKEAQEQIAAARATRP